MKIKVLSEMDHVRKNPTMYIGDNQNPSHLLTEILDNSLDELINGFATSISIDIKDNVISVSDDGRGLPIHSIDGETDDSIVVLATKLFSGSKFDMDSYQISIGQHGIGVSVVNFLSDYMIITTKYKDKFRKYTFKNGEFIKYEDLNEKFKFSTEFKFKPAKKFFKSLDIDLEPFINRLQLVKSKFKNSNLTINNQTIESVDYESYIRNLLKLDDETPLYSCSYNSRNGDSSTIYFTYDMRNNSSLSSKVIGEVNLRLAEGSFISSVLTAISNSGVVTLPKTYVIDKYDLQTRLRVFISITYQRPKFDSQNKIRLVSDVSNLIYPLTDQIEKIYKQSDYIKNALDKINEYKIIKKAKSSSKSSTKRKSVDNQIRDCIDKYGQRLYIVEGQSAAGTLIQIRDPKTEAIFPLQGKIINVTSNTFDKLLQNKEIKFLLESLGVEPGSSVEDINYKEIILLADSDPDGYHINSLVLLVLKKFIPNILDQGRVKILLAPLYAISDSKGNLKMYYTTTPPETKQGEHLFRFKGLGEMSPSQLKEVINKGKYYTVSLDTTDLSDKLFNDVEFKRQVMNDLTNSILEIYKSI